MRLWCGCASFLVWVAFDSPLTRRVCFFNLRLRPPLGLRFGPRAAVKQLFGGLWELPTAPLARRADPARALSDQLGVQLKLGKKLGTVKRVLTHRDLQLELYPVLTGRVPPHAKDYLEFRWASPSEVRDLGMSTAMRVALEAACAALPPRT